jgi:hypothetical protein
VRFQLVWVVGALLPLLFLPIPVRVGFVGIAATAAFALFSYLAGQRAARRAHDQAEAMVDGEVDVGFAEDPTQPVPAIDPTVPDATAGGDPDDAAPWQVSEPAWGGDPTEVEEDTTNVRWWPRRR